MDRRREQRFHQRLACQLQLSGRRQHALALNISPRGLFVETRAKAPARPNVAVAVEMIPPNSDAPLALQAVLVRQYWVPDQLLALAHGGMGLAIRCASGAWSDLLADLEARKPVPVHSPVMAPLRGLPRPPRCRQCRREMTWSTGVCSWCCWEP